MSFRDTHSGVSRAGVLAAVGAIHAVAFYALVTGLGGVVVKLITERPFDGYNVPREVAVPLPTKPDKPHAAIPRRETRTLPEQPFVVIDTTLKLDHDPLPPFDRADGLGDATVKPQPSPAVEPKAAVPVGKPASWASDADYPPGDLHANHEGVTRFSLAIGADGAVRGCTVTASSGWSGLDAAACRAVSNRARFRPATDSGGARVAGSYASAIHWVIPRD